MKKSFSDKEKKSIARLLLTLVLCVAFVAFYMAMMKTPYGLFVMWGYMAVLTVLALVYIFYNRGFSRRGITEDMLPEDWDEEKKRQFVQSGKDRFEKSKWMVMLMTAFVVTLLVDACVLFLLPMLSSWF